MIKADNILLEQANKFLLETKLYYPFNLFCTREMIGKEMLHSDRWGRIYDWLEKQDIDKPNGIETALTELFETTCIHVKAM